MPTYEYKCKSCEHVFEVVQSMQEDPLKICPQCQGEIYRLIGRSVGVTFKGAGFYVTDSQSSKSTPASTGPK